MDNRSTRPITPRLLRHLQQLRSCSIFDLMSLFDQVIPSQTILSEGLAGHGRIRLFSPTVTFWTFLAQVLSPGASCRTASAKARIYFSLHLGRVCSSSTAAYCQARRRLPARTLRRVAADTCEHLERTANPAWNWKRRRVLIVDGTAVSMADTKANQRRYPQSPKQSPGCGFPVMRLLVLFSLSTGALLKVATCSLYVHELRLIDRLWPAIRPGDILLGDRAFCSYGILALLLRKRADAVFRLNQRRIPHRNRIRRLGAHDFIVRWNKPLLCPKTMTPGVFEQLPSYLVLRLIEVIVPQKGFRTRHLWIATTLLNPRCYTHADLADLYRRRWAAELCIRDIKITMGMDVLKGKSPEIVRRELYMFWIAYNLVRLLMAKAACAVRTTPSSFSFKAALCTVHAWTCVFRPRFHRRHRSFRLLLLLEIASHRLPLRPPRFHPRAKKRRDKNYQLLTAPRASFCPIPHRNRYAVLLS